MRGYLGNVNKELPRNFAEQKILFLPHNFILSFVERLLSAQGHKHYFKDNTLQRGNNMAEVSRARLKQRPKRCVISNCWKPCKASPNSIVLPGHSHKFKVIYFQSIP